MNKFYLKKLKLICLAIAFFILNTNTYSQTWQSMGPEEVDGSASAEYTNVAVAPDGTVYMSYRDLGNSNKITVKKYSNSTLSIVGTAGFSAGGTYYTDIAVDKFNTPYVAYMDVANSNKATVKKYSGGSWITVGSVGFSGSTAGYVNITTSAVDGTPYVAYQDASNGSKITVKKFDGNSWVDVGSAGFSTGVANSISLTLASDGTPYVIYQDESNDFKAFVKKFDGSSWVNIGTDGIVSTGYADYNDIAITPDGTPYIIYVNESSYVNIKKFTLGSWTTLTSSSYGNASFVSIAIGSDGIPVFSYKSSTSSLSTYKYTNGYLIPYSSIYVNSSPISYPEIAVALDGYPLLYFVSGTKPYLMKYSSTNSYSELNNSSISSSYYTYQNNLAINPDGTPYISYYDNNGNLYVKKFASGTWSMVGSSIPIGIGGSSNDLAFTSTGTPYSPSNLSGVPTIRRFIGGSWQTLGTVSGYASGNVELEFDATNTPYILFSDLNTTSVKKYSGGVWLDVGTNAASDGYGVPKLKIASDGTPYIIYTERNNYRVVVKKFDGSVWVAVGTPNISSTVNSISTNFDIAFDGGTIPYIIFMEGSTSYLRKYTSGAWTTLASTSNISTSTSFYALKLALGINSTPYVAYIDNSTSKLVVKKYSNNTWSDLGGITYLSTSATSYPSLAVDAAGNVFTAYTVSNGNYAKTFGTSTVLPVKLNDFYAKPSLDAVSLNWSTASETNNSHFILERSSDGENFSYISKIPSNGDNSRYSYIDDNATNGTNYYRLTQFDKDGKSSVLGIRSVNVSLNASTNSIYPTPLTSTDFKIKLGSALKHVTRVQVFDQAGRTIATRFVKPEGDILSVQLSYKPAAGIYLVKVEGHPALKLLVN